MPTTRVVMLGAGKIGSAIGRTLAKNGVRVAYWDALPGKVRGQKPLAEIVPRASGLFLCLPSWCLREAAQSVAPLLRRGAFVVSVSKGLERGTQLASDAVLHQVLPEGAPFVYLGGPLLADELLKGQPGVGVAASADPAALRKMRALFAGTRLKIETTDDVAGTVWSAILKNVYAIGLGMTEGLGWGANARGWFTAKAVAEAGGILEDLGGRRETFHDTAGVGDFVATGFSPHSRRAMGQEGESGFRERRPGLPAGAARAPRRPRQALPDPDGHQGVPDREEEGEDGVRGIDLTRSPFRPVRWEHAHHPVFPAA
jgi:glycerol-3-phosphate dehydrogenase (NAD(P)+)